MSKDTDKCDVTSGPMFVTSDVKFLSEPIEMVDMFIPK